MADTDSQQRIASLERKLEAEPGSRVFVQLADEYRRTGQTDRAIEVLEKGLENQPGYVSALVALGRCRLAAGDPEGAERELQKVVEQDQSHLLANKLLVEAHLQTGDAEGARKRLEFYKMLADSDPEVEELEQRVGRAEGGGTSDEQEAAETSPPPPPPAAGTAEAAPDARAETPAAGDSGVGEAGTEDDVFDLGLAAEASDDDLPFPELAAPPASSGHPVAPEEGPGGGEDLSGPSGPGVDDEPFGSLLRDDDLDRWGERFGQEGIFTLGSEGDAPGEAVAPAGEAEGAIPRTDDAAGEARATGGPEAEDEDEATLTLGQLYLSQGHGEEAARIFRKVLEREPDNPIARSALDTLEARREAAGDGSVSADRAPEADVDSRETAAAGPALEEEPAPPVSAPSPAPIPPQATEGTAEGGAEGPGFVIPASIADVEGVTPRKIAVLRAYMERIRSAEG